MKRLALAAVCIVVISLSSSAGATTLKQKVDHWSNPVLPAFQKVVKSEIKLDKLMKYLDDPKKQSAFQNLGYAFWNEQSTLKIHVRSPVPQLTVEMTALYKGLYALGGDVEFAFMSNVHALSTRQLIERDLGRAERDMTLVLNLIKKYGVSSN